MDRSRGTLYLKQKFPKIFEAKIKEGIFVGPQLQGLMKNGEFDNLVTDDELRAWRDFKKVVTDILENSNAENYSKIVTDLLSAYKKLRCNMSLNIHFLVFHLDLFPGFVCDTKLNEVLICWTLLRDSKKTKYRRKTSAITF